GMMQGVNLDSTVELAAAITIPVIASGGVTDMNDIDALCAIEEEGVRGVIIGRAIYEGTLDLKTALERVASS
ncbi:MAG: 1-(5-phosphoribosyl)-5-((5-phosphoribosylamino)methylideneamino)imidazole-4-carboxamide isomerase, partial [Gammaproteobacteria bacterium]